MKPCAYYTFDNDKAIHGASYCSIASDEYPVAVNCAGNFQTSRAFFTDNVRKDYYLMYVLRGSLRVFLPDGEHLAPPRTLLIFPPDEHYRYAHDANEEISYVWIHFTGAYVGKLLSSCGFTLPYSTHIRSDTQLLYGIDKLFEIFEYGSPFRTEELGCALERMILDIALDVSVKKQDRLFERSRAYIHSSFNEEIRIPELAAMEALSNSRYITLFKQSTGRSPSEYVIDVRISNACHLLTGSDMSIKEIGSKVGYADPHFFSRIFKKRLGCSPMEYRNKYKLNGYRGEYSEE